MTVCAIVSFFQWLLLIRFTIVFVDLFLVRCVISDVGWMQCELLLLLLLCKIVYLNSFDATLFSVEWACLCVWACVYKEYVFLDSIWDLFNWAATNPRPTSQEITHTGTVNRGPLIISSLILSWISNHNSICVSSKLIRFCCSRASCLLLSIQLHTFSQSIRPMHNNNTSTHQCTQCIHHVHHAKVFAISHWDKHSIWIQSVHLPHSPNYSYHTTITPFPLSPLSRWDIPLSPFA